MICAEYSRSIFFSIFVSFHQFIRIFNKGMRYLHRSAIKYHGNLKSRNCVVDSRWVLKITDYGLPRIYASQSFSRSLDLSDLLWTAPEHLRLCNLNHRKVISVGSPAADVYSFGIIIQEVLLRGPPFCTTGMSHLGKKKN